jgi:hypothetical protein
MLKDNFVLGSLLLLIAFLFFSVLGLAGRIQKCEEQIKDLSPYAPHKMPAYKTIHFDGNPYETIKPCYQKEQIADNQPFGSDTWTTE